MVTAFRFRAPARAACWTCAIALFATAASLAGEISGLPSHVPPTVRPDYLYFLGNDFAASGTSDDFRTEQMMVAGRFGDSWLAVLDHSILTRDDLADVLSPVLQEPAQLLGRLHGLTRRGHGSDATAERPIGGLACGDDNGPFLAQRANDPRGRGALAAAIDSFECQQETGVHLRLVPPGSRPRWRRRARREKTLGDLDACPRAAAFPGAGMRLALSAGKDAQASPAQHPSNGTGGAAGPRRPGGSLGFGVGMTTTG